VTDDRSINDESIETAGSPTSTPPKCPTRTPIDWAARQPVWSRRCADKSATIEKAFSVVFEPKTAAAASYGPVFQPRWASFNLTRRQKALKLIVLQKLKNLRLRSRNTCKALVSAKEQKMLVLSRKKDESIVINNDITIVVVEIRGDKVRLGVEAPKEVPVHRREVFDAIARGQSIDNPLPEMRTGTEHTAVERVVGESISLNSIVSEASSAVPVELLPPAADAVS